MKSCIHNLFMIDCKGQAVKLQSWVWLHSERSHRRTSQAAGGLQPSWLGQSHYFWAKAKFFRQKPSAKKWFFCIY